MPKSKAVFDAIAALFLKERTEDLLRFAKTSYSFEEWCNWEAFSACDRQRKWRTHPKWAYSSLGQPSKNLADLLVEDRRGGGGVVVEVGLLHDHTQDKWRRKLDADALKLRQLDGSGLKRLQLIVLVTADEQGATSETWKTWLELCCWSRDTKMYAEVSTENGCVAVKGL